ncbi:phage tail tube protein [Paludisphaera rhizosphaerae]|uniref:phage tail tube protein n=1 Tax=Paludisphaera rhizosphaerae TaxID=2711216 RepID=UPI0013E9F90C|nr:phage tail tube protein [Paludisphaera rhizosphaerae]
MSIYIGQGTTLSVAKVAGTYTALGQITSIDGPSSSVGSIETTNLSSTRKTYRPGIPDGGEISATIQMDPADANQVYLAGLADAPVVKSWQVSFPTTPATLFTVDGFLTDFSPSAGGVEDVTEVSVTIKCTGAVVITTVSGS